MRNKGKGMHGRLVVLTGLALMVACAAERPVAPAAPSAGDGTVAASSNYSMTAANGERMVYVRFTRVRSEGAESVSDFMDRVFATSDSINAERLVIDVSALQGGDAFLLTALIRGVTARERLQRAGAIVVIAGPQSFSPRQNLVRMLAQYARPVVVDRATIRRSLAI